MYNWSEKNIIIITKVSPLVCCIVIHHAGADDWLMLHYVLTCLRFFSRIFLTAFLNIHSFKPDLQL